MVKFNNLETTMMAKWYGNQIEEMILNNPRATKTDLICILSEGLENLVKEDISLLTEGYVSEVIGESFEKVNYHDLIDYFKDDEPLTEFGVVINKQQRKVVKVKATNASEALELIKEQMNKGELEDSDFEEGDTDLSLE